MFQVSGVPVTAVASSAGVAGAPDPVAHDADDNKHVIAGTMSGVVADLCSRGRYVFVTSLTDHFYESFGPCWADFVAAVAQFGGKPNRP
jgi:hypothetical protein